MDRTSEGRRTAAYVAVIALLVAALGTLVTAPGSESRHDVSVDRTAAHETRALDALRTGSFAVLHHLPHRERMPSRVAPAAGGVLAFAGAARSRLDPATATTPTGAHRWWGGRCWRAPPVTATA